MLVNRRLLTITLTWKSSHVIANYNRKTSEIHLFKRVIMLFRSLRCKEVHMRNIVPVIDVGVSHKYVHVCKQLFSCDVIRSRCRRSTPLSSVSHLFVRSRRERKGATDKKKDHGAVGKPSSE